LCSDVEQTGRWVGTKVSKEHMASNPKVPPKHQHPPNSLHGAVTYEAEITIFNSTLKFVELLLYQKQADKVPAPMGM
jgi:hypothetical protein